MKFLSAAALSSVLLVACGEVGSVRPTVVVEVEIEKPGARAFSDLGVRFGNERGLKLEGPEVRPGADGDDFVLVLREAQLFHITINTQSERKTGSAVFYCDKHSDEALKKVKQAAKDLAGFLVANLTNTRVDVFKYAQDKRELTSLAGIDAILECR